MENSPARSPLRPRNDYNNLDDIQSQYERQIRALKNQIESINKRLLSSSQTVRSSLSNFRIDIEKIQILYSKIKSSYFISQPLNPSIRIANSKDLKLPYGNQMEEIISKIKEQTILREMEIENLLETRCSQNNISSNIFQLIDSIFSTFRWAISSARNQPDLMTAHRFSTYTEGKALNYTSHKDFNITTENLIEKLKGVKDQLKSLSEESFKSIPIENSESKNRYTYKNELKSHLTENNNIYRYDNSNKDFATEVKIKKNNNEEYLQNKISILVNELEELRKSKFLIEQENYILKDQIREIHFSFSKKKNTGKIPIDSIKFIISKIELVKQNCCDSCKCNFELLIKEIKKMKMEKFNTPGEKGIYKSKMNIKGEININRKNEEVGINNDNNKNNKNNKFSNSENNIKIKLEIKDQINRLDEALILVGNGANIKFINLIDKIQMLQEKLSEINSHSFVRFRLEKDKTINSLKDKIKGILIEKNEKDKIISKLKELYANISKKNKYLVNKIYKLSKELENIKKNEMPSKNQSPLIMKNKKDTPHQTHLQSSREKKGAQNIPAVKNKLNEEILVEDQFVISEKVSQRKEENNNYNNSKNEKSNQKSNKDKIHEIYKIHELNEHNKINEINEIKEIEKLKEELIQKEENLSSERIQLSSISAQNVNLLKECKLLKNNLEQATKKFTDQLQIIEELTQEINKMKVLNDALKNKINQNDFNTTNNQLIKQTSEKYLLEINKISKDNLILKTNQDQLNEKYNSQTISFQNIKLHLEKIDLLIKNESENKNLPFNYKEDETVYNRLTLLIQFFSEGLKSQEEQIINLTQKLSEFKSKDENFKTESNRLDEIVNQKQNEINEINEEKKSLENQFSNTVEKYKEKINSSLSEIAKLANELTICKEEKKKESDTIEIVKQENERIKEKVNGQLKKINEMSISINNLEMKERQLTVLEEKYEKMKIEIKQKDNSIEQFKDNILRKENEIVSIQQKNNEVIQNFNNASNEATILKTDIKILSEKLETEKVKLNLTIDNLNHEINEKNKTIYNLNNQLSNDSRLISALKDSVEEFKQKIFTLNSHVDKYKEEIQKSNNLIFTLEERYRKANEESIKSYQNEIQTLKNTSLMNKENQENQNKLFLHRFSFQFLESLDIVKSQSKKNREEESPLFNNLLKEHAILDQKLKESEEKYIKLKLEFNETNEQMSKREENINDLLKLISEDEKQHESEKEALLQKILELEEKLMVLDPNSRRSVENDIIIEEAELEESKDNDDSTILKSDSRADT